MLIAPALWCRFIIPTMMGYNLQNKTVIVDTRICNSVAVWWSRGMVVCCEAFPLIFCRAHVNRALRCGRQSAKLLQDHPHWTGIGNRQPMSCGPWDLFNVAAMHGLGAHRCSGDIRWAGKWPLPPALWMNVSRRSLVRISDWDGISATGMRQVLRAPGAEYMVSLGAITTYWPPCGRAVPIAGW